MVKAGLSDVIGSWKIIEMRSPRTARIRAAGSASRFAPSKRISPAAMRPGGLATSPMMESAVTLLPQPDSPTSPSVRPASSVKLTSSTALKVPASVAKEVVRPRTSRSGLTVGSALGALGLEARHLGVDHRAVGDARGPGLARQAAHERLEALEAHREEPPQLGKRLGMVVH